MQGDESLGGGNVGTSARTALASASSASFQLRRPQTIQAHLQGLLSSAAGESDRLCQRSFFFLSLFFFPGGEPVNASFVSSFFEKSAARSANKPCGRRSVTHPPRKIPNCKPWKNKTDVGTLTPSKSRLIAPNGTATANENRLRPATLCQHRWKRSHPRRAAQLVLSRLVRRPLIMRRAAKERGATATLP